MHEMFVGLQTKSRLPSSDLLFGQTRDDDYDPEEQTPPVQYHWASLAWYALHSHSRRHSGVWNLTDSNYLTGHNINPQRAIDPDALIELEAVSRDASQFVILTNELLDFDAEGDLDMDINIDETTADVLLKCIIYFPASLNRRNWIRPNLLPRTQIRILHNSMSSSKRPWLSCHEKWENEAVTEADMIEESDPDPDSSPVEHIHLGEEIPIETDWTPLEPGSLEYKINQMETDIIRLESQVSRQKDKISDLEEYVTALEKARDLLPLMRASHNDAVDRLIDARAEVDRLCELFALGFKRMIKEFTEALAQQISTLISANYWTEMFEGSMASFERNINSAPPEGLPEGLGAWVTPWIQRERKWAAFF
ncbi:hypothetical protein C8J56DRAFT_883400 [Mycena floridula]|nr:hypothetical protein C8J56DRAFT_883400 [Mycena floridula]